VADKNAVEKIAADQRKKQAGHDNLAAQIESMVQTLKENGLSIE
jgi:hypothetical protein